MKRFVLLLVPALAFAGCATMEDLGRALDFGTGPHDGCRDMELDAEDIPVKAIAIPMTEHWFVYQKYGDDIRSPRFRTAVIKAAQRGFLGNTGATLEITIAAGPLPETFGETEAKPLIPSDAMIGDIDRDERLITFRWIKHDAHGWRNGQVTIATTAAKPERIAVFSAEWPRDLEESSVLDDVHSMIDAVSRGCHE